MAPSGLGAKLRCFLFLITIYIVVSVPAGEARQHLRSNLRVAVHNAGSQEQSEVQREGLPDAETKINKIPHILHFIYLSGFDSFVAAAEAPRSKLSKKYYDSCVAVHPHWEIKFWTNEMADEFIKTHFAWFLPVWESYDMEVKRADALRPFLLYHYGGLYLDLDNECFEPAEKLFLDHDVVLQGSGWEGVNNGVMASAPGHRLWMIYADLLLERKTGSETEIFKNLPQFMTGPNVLNAVVKIYLDLPGYISGFLHKQYEADGMVIMVYPLGEFFMPCWEADQICQRQFERGMAAGLWDDVSLVGRHWFAGTWNRPDLLFPKKDGQ